MGGGKRGSGSRKMIKGQEERRGRKKERWSQPFSLLLSLLSSRLLPGLDGVYFFLLSFLSFFIWIRERWRGKKVSKEAGWQAVGFGRGREGGEGLLALDRRRTGNNKKNKKSRCDPLLKPRTNMLQLILKVKVTAVCWTPHMAGYIPEFELAVCLF